jgi:hypothetical protein
VGEGWVLRTDDGAEERDDDDDDDDDDDYGMIDGRRGALG